MRDIPIRIQGGVFVWLCAVFAVGAAAYCVCNLYAGFWELFFSVALSSGVCFCAYGIFKKLIIKNAGSVEGEHGPLLGISIATVSVFFSLYFQDIHESRADFEPCYVSSFFRSLVECGIFAGTIWIGAKGLNRHRFDLGCGVLRNLYDELAEPAKLALIAFTLLASLSVIFTFAAFLVTGLSISVWIAMGNLVISSVVYLVALAKSRRLFFDMFTGFLQSEEDRRHNPSDCKNLADEGFSLYELCAALSAGGFVTLLFMAFPRLLGSAYLIVMSCGMLFAGVSEAVLVLCDKVKVNERLRNRWRVEAKSRLDEHAQTKVERRRTLIKEQVLAGLDLTALGEWELDEKLTATTESLRRMLNYHFCEDGRMMYLNPVAAIGKDVAYRRKAESMVCEIFSEESVGALYDANTTDEELDMMLRELNELGDGELSSKDEELVETYCAQMQEVIAGLDLQPYATMPVDVSGRDGSVRLELEVERSGIVRICWPTGEMLTCEMSNAIKVIENKLAA